VVYELVNLTRVIRYSNQAIGLMNLVSIPGQGETFSLPGKVQKALRPIQSPIKLKSAVFWDITRRRVIIFYRRFPLGLLTSEYGTDTLSRNVGKQLPYEAV
jgi:hypothetical protein